MELPKGPGKQDTWGVLRQKEDTTGKGSGPHRERWPVKVLQGTSWRGGRRVSGFSLSGYCTYTSLPTASREFHRHTSVSGFRGKWRRMNQVRTGQDRTGQESREQLQRWEANETVEGSKNSEAQVTRAPRDSQQSWEGHCISHGTWDQSSKRILWTSPRQLYLRWHHSTLSGYRLARCCHISVIAIGLPSRPDYARSQPLLTSHSGLVPPTSRHSEIPAEWIVFFSDQNLRWIKKGIKITKMGKLHIFYLVPCPQNGNGWKFKMPKVIWISLLVKR